MTKLGPTLSLLFLLVSACGDSAQDGSSSSTGGASSSSGAVTAEDQALCSEACDHVVACAKARSDTSSDLEPGKCAEQCLKELSGSGFLDPEVARYGFEAKRSLGSGPDWANFDLFQEIYDGDYEMLSRTSVIDDCEAQIESSLCQKTTPGGERQLCFQFFVQYAPRYRAAYENCGYPKQPCDAYEECIRGAEVPEALTAGGSPWYGPQFSQQ